MLYSCTHRATVGVKGLIYVTVLLPSWLRCNEQIEHSFSSRSLGGRLKGSYPCPPVRLSVTVRHIHRLLRQKQHMT